jgi:hypothetical protein
MRYEAQAGFKVACWHADLDPDKLAQTGRLFCDNNLPPAEHLLQCAEERQAFVHPDDLRNPLHKSGTSVCPRVHTLVSTDAALKAVPQVCTLCLLSRPARRPVCHCAMTGLQVFVLSQSTEKSSMICNPEGVVAYLVRSSGPCCLYP